MQTRREFERRTQDLPRESFGELLGQLANNSAALVRDEIELARQEITEKVIVLRSGITIAAIGLVIGLVAVLTLTAAAVIGLAHFCRRGNLGADHRRRACHHRRDNRLRREPTNQTHEPKAKTDNRDTRGG